MPCNGSVKKVRLLYVAGTAASIAIVVSLPVAFAKGIMT
jgi:hypothetical protein